MSLRALYSLVGATWGAVIGAPATILVGGFLLGAAWLFAFGDDPWPVGSGLVLLPALMLGVAIFVVAAGIGYRYGARREARLRMRRTNEQGETDGAPTEATLRRRAVWLIGLAVLVGLIEVGAVSALERGQQAERERAAELRANFDRLVEQRHAIAGIDIVLARSAEAVAETGIRRPSQAAISLSGERAGDYGVAWELRETLHDTPLLVGERRLTLARGDTTVLVPIDMRTVRERYRSEVLSGRGGVLVESEWPLRVSIRPLLSGEETQSLPRSELQNLRLGMSALISEAEAPVPVYFRID